jgi:hypothetical protein
MTARQRVCTVHGLLAEGEFYASVRGSGCIRCIRQKAREYNASRPEERQAYNKRRQEERRARAAAEQGRAQEETRVCEVHGVLAAGQFFPSYKRSTGCIACHMARMKEIQVRRRAAQAAVRAKKKADEQQAVRPKVAEHAPKPEDGHGPIYAATADKSALWFRSMRPQP